ncbi:MAG TPA: ketopantoate reductase family protein [Patescibacteria group bacterium]|nr:ketopantoate reductase family protein [Patescibacteria group bacterium]
MGRSRDFARVVIMGAGAIGSYYGALLSRKVDVLLVGRKAHVDAVKKHGLKATGEVNGVFSLEAATELDGVLEETLFIVTTKAHDTEVAVGGVKEFIRLDTTILVLQNGLGNENIVRALVEPRVEVVRGLTTGGIEMPAPGRIDVRLIGETVLPRSPAGERIMGLLGSCGIPTRLTDEMDYEVWKKVAMNCVINPLSAIFRVPDSDIADESLRAVRESIVEECINVAEEEGVTLESSLADGITRAASSYSNVSSMCQDLLRGRRTEIDFLNGKVVELGRRHGVPTPVNGVITQLVRFMEGREWTWRR